MKHKYKDMEETPLSQYIRTMSDGPIKDRLIEIEKNRQEYDRGKVPVPEQKTT